jgi:hypothetical protein
MHVSSIVRLHGGTRTTRPFHCSILSLISMKLAINFWGRLFIVCNLCIVACSTRHSTNIRGCGFDQISTFHTAAMLVLKNSNSVKWSRYRPGGAQRVGRGIALLFHDRDTGRGWVVSSTSRPHFTPGKDPVPILQEAGWAPGPVWTGGKSPSHGDSIPDRPARSQSLYRLS